MTHPTKPEPVPRCRRGTYNGAAAEASKFGFAPCTLAFDHPNIGSGCDSGPASDAETQQAA